MLFVGADQSEKFVLKALVQRFGPGETAFVPEPCIPHILTRSAQLPADPIISPYQINWIKPLYSQVAIAPHKIKHSERIPLQNFCGRSN
jgi:hypothetical protein